MMTDQKSEIVRRNLIYNHWCSMRSSVKTAFQEVKVVEKVTFPCHGSLSLYFMVFCESAVTGHMANRVNRN